MTKIETTDIQPQLIKVIYTFECSQCHDLVDQIWTGQYADPPTWPDGWKRVMGMTPTGFNRWLCPKHTLKVEIDGVETEP